MKRRGMNNEIEEPNKNNGAQPSNFRVVSTAHRKEIDDIVLWKSPLLTLQYFFLELCVQTTSFIHQLIVYKKHLLFFFLLSCLYFHLNKLNGAHQEWLQYLNNRVSWSFYWLGLGILSSVGLGTGLHTFLLYLGPHIAAVTLAAFECQSVDFPEPPYPNDIICPEETSDHVTLWTIMSKVRWECFMWGTGTAIGELPPYFMARAARLHGQVVEEEGEVEDILMRGSKSMLEKAKVFMYEAVNKVGFVGILFCASIPNPLFDLAGITCGHFLVPFWTFFGATLIGKALIKMHIQKLFVIFLFSEHHVQSAVDVIKKAPWAGGKLKELLEDFLRKQKMKMHHKTIQDENWLSWIFGKVVLVMVVYFVVSIINSMAQANAKRQKEAEN